MYFHAKVVFQRFANPPRRKISFHMLGKIIKGRKHYWRVYKRSCTVLLTKVISHWHLFLSWMTLDTRTAFHLKDMTGSILMTFCVNPFSPEPLTIRNCSWISHSFSQPVCIYITYIISHASNSNDPVKKFKEEFRNHIWCHGNLTQ